MMMKLLLTTLFSVLLTATAFAEAITVDLNTNGGAAAFKGAGFLHGFDATNPADSTMTPLKITHFRCGFDNEGCPASYDRIQAFGTLVNAHWSLADRVGFSAPWPGDGGSLVDGVWVGGDYTELITKYTETVTDAVNAGQTKWIWDLWNEPDVSTHFWQRSQAQFFATWKVAYQTVRGVDATAKISGPSVAFQHPTSANGYVQQFLTYAAANNVCPTYVSWHELNGPDTEGFHSIETSVANVMNYITTTGKCNGIVLGVSINEYIGNHEVTVSGPAVRYLAAFERLSNVYAAIHACWEDPVTPYDTCATIPPMLATLDGLLTVPAQTPPRSPRANWYVWKKYADVVGTKVTVTYDTGTADGLAAKDGTNVRILLGRNNGCCAGFAPVTVTVNNISSGASYLNVNGQVRVTAQRLPSGGQNASAGPTTNMLDTNVAVVNNSISFTLSLDSLDAAFITLGSGTASLQASLTWGAASDNVGVVGYNIRRCTVISPATSCTPTTTFRTLGNVLSNADATVLSGTGYCYTINAFDGANPANQGPYTTTPQCFGVTTPTVAKRLLDSDNFNRANNTDMGAKWAPGYTGNGPLQIISNQLRPTALNTDALETFTASVATPNDQWAQFTLTQVGGSGTRAPRVLVRFSGPATINGYECGPLLPSTMRCGEWNTNVFTQKTTGSFTFAAGDKVRVEAVGTSVCPFVIRAGVETTFPTLCFTDATHASGLTGIIHYQQTGVLGDTQVDDFEMGDFSSAPPVPPSITAVAADATGATLTHGAVTATTIRVFRGNNSSTFSRSEVRPISDFPSGRFTFDWEDGLNFVCFYPRDAAGVENVPGGICDSLTEWVNPIDQTPVTISNAQPSGIVPSGTAVTLSVSLNKQASCRRAATDIAYSAMTDQMTISALTASFSLGTPADGSQTPNFIRCNFVNSLDEAWPNLSGFPHTVTMGAPADLTPPVMTGSQTITLPAGTTSRIVTLNTNENGTVKGSLSAGTAYAAMAITFAGTGTQTHTHTLSGLTNGSTTILYARASDGTNVTTTDYSVTVTVEAAPPDLTEPQLSSLSPFGTLAAGTTTTNITFTTNFASNCKSGSEPGRAYTLVHPFWSLLDTTGGTSHSETIAPLTDNSFYTYYVKCQRIDTGVANTADTVFSWFVAVAAGDTTPPVAVIDLVVNARSSSEADAVWTATTDNVAVRRYHLSISTDCVAYTIAAIIDHPTAATILSSLTPSTAYCASMIAEDTSGNLSTVSNIASFTTPTVPDVVPPSTMTNLRCTACTVIGGLYYSAFTQAVELIWDQGTDDRVGVTSQIEMAIGEFCDPFIQVSSDIAVTTLRVDLAASTTYCFRGTHSDGTNVSVDYSNVFKIATVASGLPQPRLPLPFGVERESATRDASGTRTPRP